MAPVAQFTVIDTWQATPLSAISRWSLVGWYTGCPAEW